VPKKQTNTGHRSILINDDTSCGHSIDADDMREGTATEGYKYHVTPHDMAGELSGSEIASELPTDNHDYELSASANCDSHLPTRESLTTTCIAEPERIEAKSGDAMLQTPDMLLLLGVVPNPSPDQMVAGSEHTRSIPCQPGEPESADLTIDALRPATSKPIMSAHTSSNSIQGLEERSAADGEVYSDSDESIPTIIEVQEESREYFAGQDDDPDLVPLTDAEFRGCGADKSLLDSNQGRSMDVQSDLGNDHQSSAVCTSLQNKHSESCDDNGQQVRDCEHQTNTGSIDSPEQPAICNSLQICPTNLEALSENTCQSLDQTKRGDSDSLSPDNELDVLLPFDFMPLEISPYCDAHDDEKCGMPKDQRDYCDREATHQAEGYSVVCETNCTIPDDHLKRVTLEELSTSSMAARQATGRIVRCAVLRVWPSALGSHPPAKDSNESCQAGSAALCTE